MLIPAKNQKPTSMDFLFGENHHRKAPSKFSVQNFETGLSGENVPIIQFWWPWLMLITLR
jgi:hypothetical protein